MATEEILVPRTMEVLLKGVPFCFGKNNYRYNVPDALEACQEKHTALTAIEIADTKTVSAEESPIWQKWYTSTSLRTTGRTKQGKPVVAYVHVPHVFCRPGKIRKAIDAGLRNGAGKMPEKEFDRLLELEDGENVFVIDYKKLLNSQSAVIPLSKAMKHPQTIPFLGGEERAEKYLEQHQHNIGDKIGIWHSDDLSDEGPYGRLLVFGLLLGDYGLDFNARFVGVSMSAEGAAQKILGPTLEEIAQYSSRFVPEAAAEEFKKGLPALWEK